MQVSAIGLAAIKSREGVRLDAYLDSVGVPTIDWGHTKGVRMGQRITRAQAEAFLAEDIDTHAAPIFATIKVPVADHEADALASIAFNIGVGGFKRSTFLKRLNAGDRAGCAVAIMQWLKPPAITTRRTAERDQFLTPYDVELPKARSDDASPVKLGATTPAARQPKAQRVWAEQLLSVDEIKYIQGRMLALGYHDVGLVDGDWTQDGKLAGGVKMLQARAKAMGEDVKVDGHWGPETKNLIDPVHGSRYRNVVSAQRGATTAGDLAKIGTPGVVQGRRIQWASLLGALSALVGAAYSAWQAPAELPFGSSIALAFLPPWAQAAAPFLFTFLPLAYTALAGSRLVGTTVERFREGIDNTGLSPAAERGPGGLFGSLFGAR